MLNGSRSSDDLGIVKWEWIRESSSLALGQVIDNSDHSPVLMVSYGLLKKTCVNLTSLTHGLLRS